MIVTAADGTLHSETKLAGAITHVQAADLDGAGRPELVTITRTGIVVLRKDKP